MSIKTLLQEEFKDQMGALNKIEVGSEEYKITVDGVTKLADRIIEIDKNEAELELKREMSDKDAQLKLMEQEAEKKDRLVKNCLTGASIGGGIGLTIWGALKSWEFEKEGTVNSAFGKMFMSMFKFKK